MTAGTFHTPVMIHEVLDFFKGSGDGVYVDGTLGSAGHAVRILEHTGNNSVLIGIDCDDDAIAESRARLAPFGNRAIVVKDNFAAIDIIISKLGIKEVNGLFLDLGVSSHQFDTAERGFSIYGDAPLDMRMNRKSGMTAFDIVNGATEERLRHIIRNFGEEVHAVKIARSIVAARHASLIRTTGELATLVETCLPPAVRRRKIHPATRTFQALRIAVNDELNNLISFIEKGVALLHRGGRIAIISFHSLEDRIVKNLFKSFEKGCICPDDFPFCTCGKKSALRILTKKPVTPSAGELKENPRARSARLRAAEKA